MKYIIVGTPFVEYTGTMTYTGIKKVGEANTDEEMKKIIEENYDRCCGLISSVNVETGEVHELGNPE